ALVPYTTLFRSGGPRGGHSTRINNVCPSIPRTAAVQAFRKALEAGFLPRRQAGGADPAPWGPRRPCRGATGVLAALSGQGEAADPARGDFPTRRGAMRGHVLHSRVSAGYEARRQLGRL